MLHISFYEVKFKFKKKRRKTLVHLIMKDEHNLKVNALTKRERKKNRMNKSEERRTEFESVKRYLEKGESSTADDEFPPKFLEPLILDGIRLDLIKPGRVVFSMNIPPRLLVLFFNLLFIFP